MNPRYVTPDRKTRRKNLIVSLLLALFVVGVFGLSLFHVTSESRVETSSPLK